MKRIYLLCLLFSLFYVSKAQQDEEIRKMKQEYEQYVNQSNQDLANWKKKYEEGIKKMEQEYQDYYNSMVGLKDFYVKKKDTASANYVGNIIKYEEDIRNALGKQLKVTQPSRSQQALPANQGQQQPQQYQQAQPQQAPQQPQQSQQPQPQQQVSPQPQQQAQQQQAQPHQQPQPQSQSQQPEQQQAPLITSNEPPVDIQPPPDGKETVPCIYPLPNSKARVTSPFGPRVHPILNKVINHNGIDFGCGKMTDIYAAGNGKVILAEFNKGFGNYIIVQHEEGFASVYAHLEKLNVSKGDIVTKGQLIGESGSTGRSTGPHLHYEVRVTGTPIDPKPFLH